MTVRSTPGTGRSRRTVTDISSIPEETGSSPISPFPRKPPRVISKDGEITCLSSDDLVIATGQIPIYTFTNPAGLKAVGMNAFIPTEASGDPIEGIPGTDNFGTIAQGYLEMSNVDAIEEMINMIVGQRAYEINSKSIKTADTMLGVVTSLSR